MVFFYAKYDYKTPGLSGGGIWAYGSNKNGQQNATPSKIPQSTNKKTQNKASSSKDDAKSTTSEQASRFQHAASTTPPKGTFTSRAMSNVAQTEALGPITSAPFDKKVQGIDARLGKIQEMIIGGIDYQKNLQECLKTSTETQSRLQASLDLGNQNAKLMDSLNAAKNENVDLKLRMKSSERNHLVKCNSLDQDYRKNIHKYREQQRALEHRLQVTQKEHDHLSKETQIQHKNDIAHVQRRYDDIIRENTTTLEKKSELVQQLQAQLDTIATKLQREHAVEIKVYEKDIRRLQEEVNGHQSERSDLIQQHKEEVESLRVTEEVLRKIAEQQASKDDLKKAHEEQTISLQAIERGIQEMDGQHPDKDYIVERYEEQVKSLQAIEQRLEEMDKRQLDKDTAIEKYEEQTKSLKALEKRLQEIDATRHEEQVMSLQSIERHLEEIDSRQLDKDNAAAKHEEQMNLLNRIGEHLEEINTRQIDMGNTAERYEEQVESLNAIKTRLEEMDARQLEENGSTRYEDQINSLNAMGKRLDEMIAQQVDKEDAAQKHNEEVQILGRIEGLLKDLNDPETDAKKKKEQSEAFWVIEALINNLNERQPDKHFLETKYEEQEQELKMIGDLVRNLGTQLPHSENLVRTHQEQMQALGAIGDLVKGISTQNFAQRHEEQVKAITILEDRLKEATIQQPNKEELTKNHEEQLLHLKSLESEFKAQLEKVESAINAFGSEQYGKEYLELKHQEILQALERNRQVEPDDSLKNQLTSIQQLLEKIDDQQQSAQSVVPEQLSRALDDSRLQNATSAEDAELLRKMKGENEDMQRRFHELTTRLEESNRALDLARSEMQQTKLEKEALEKSIEREKDDVQNSIATMTLESEAIHSEAKDLKLERDVSRLEWGQERADLVVKNTALGNQLQEMMQKAERHEYERRCLFEQVQTLRGNIRVMCRIRPPAPGTPREQLVDFYPAKGEYMDHYQKIEVIAERATATGAVRQSSKFLECERIFTPDHTNKDVFEEISQLTASAMQGKKATIFCYGQTGSGKTFTMNHRVHPAGAASDDDGIIHRSLAMLFADAESSKDRYRYDMKMSIMEVYINDLIDLLHIRKKHTIRNMDDATEIGMMSHEAVNELIEKALNNRVVGATNANASSSRSHLILSFKIQRTIIKGPEQGKADTGILNLIDLAGSEKNKETGATGQRLEESKAINGSIFELNQSITALAEGRPKRPGHTLTRVLDPCLAKGCRVVMFIMVSPLKRDQPETENTMAKAETVSLPDPPPTHNIVVI